jgi:hypothetical protein
MRRSQLYFTAYRTRIPFTASSRSGPNWQGNWFRGDLRQGAVDLVFGHIQSKLIHALFSAVMDRCRLLFLRWTTSHTASGCAEATSSRTRAGPFGIRRFCSQFSSVLTLIPSNEANSSWDTPGLALIALTSS